MTAQNLCSQLLFLLNLIIHLNLVWLLKENDESVKGKGCKRAAPRGRGRGSTQSSKRGRASDNSTVHRMLMSKDDDDDDDDDDDGAAKRPTKPQPRVRLHFFPFPVFCCTG